MLAHMRRAARRAALIHSRTSTVCVGNASQTPSSAAAASSRALASMLTTQRAISGRVAAVRAFSTDGSAPTPAPVDAIEENRFLELADTALHDIMSWLDGVEEMLEESDISLSQGVLKIDLGEDGTWVINRQIPNRQIWWSSPISGPRRYEYDAETNTWVNTRDGTELMELLRNEIFEATGIEIYE
uniref:ferroxidase n=1 Tax=Globisporangium ultimum (strain ATCC 200006 / CBS 805.95 / DAOM BR144) TaxID=431595 RepID=K3WUV1_GLOUD